MSNSTLLQRVDYYADYIRKHRPLTQDELRELDAYYKIGVTYSSNALEGNSLTLSETKVLLEDGITVGGKPIRDCYEATGHAKAYDYMLGIARSGELKITEEMIQQLHFLFYNAVDSETAGQYRKGQVFISGTEYIPPSAEQISELMAEFIEKLSKEKDNLHPVEYAAYAHRRLVDIHPFSDGNGRTARLLMNMILINKGYCIVSIPPILRHEYISALRMAQRAEHPSDEAFVRLVAQCELEAQKDYFRMFHMPLPEKNRTEPER